MALVDGAHWELRAVSAGELRHQHAPVGRRVESGDWLATATAPPVLVDLVNGTSEVLRAPDGLDITYLDLHWSGRAVAIGQRNGPALILDLDEGGAESPFSRFSMDDFAELGHNTPVSFAPTDYRLVVSAADNRRFHLSDGAAVDEYESKQSAEALCARDADKLEMLLQAVEYREIGVRRVEGWIDSARKRIQTEAGQRIAEAAVLLSPLAWRDR